MSMSSIALADIAEARKNKQMRYDTIPLPATVWDELGRSVDCNDATLKSKKELFVAFFLYLPEIQPDGMYVQCLLHHLLY